MSLPQTAERADAVACPLCGAGRLWRWVDIRTILNGDAVETYRVTVCAADVGADHELHEACIRSPCGQPHRRCGWVYHAERLA